jgi:hypothetical protein
MGFAMLLALPAMLLVGTLLDVATADDSHASDTADAEPQTAHGDLLDETEHAA